MGTTSTTGAVLYELHGLRLRSELELAGFALGGTAHDLDVLRARSAPVPDGAPPGEALVDAVDGGGGTPHVCRQHHRVTVRLPGRSEFVIDRARRTVTCTTDPTADEGLTSVLVAGLVVALVLELDGHPVLHASAVEVDGAAMAFAGPSGAGKSTLAALMCAAGARLVCDDVLRVEPVGDGLVCVRGGPQLRLRPGASWALRALRACAAPPALGASADGRLTVAPRATREARLPLRVIVVPRLTSTGDRVALRRLSGGEAMSAIAGAHRVVGWTRPEAVRRQFDHTAEVAERTHVVEATIPRASPAREQLVPVLRSLVAALPATPAGVPA